VAEANNRHVGRPIAHPADKIEYARSLKAQGSSLGVIAAKTEIPTTSASLPHLPGGGSSVSFLACSRRAASSVSIPSWGTSRLDKDPS
jgi:hypothetical protein